MLNLQGLCIIQYGHSTYALTCAAQTVCPDAENLSHAKHPDVGTTKHKCSYADGQYLNTEY